MIRCSSTWFVLAATLALLVGVVARSEAGIDVNGVLSDWGITVSDSKKLAYNGTTYSGYVSSPRGDFPGTRGSGEFGGMQVFYHLEDSCDTSNDYQVGPLYGGQDYDAEALLVTLNTDETTLKSTLSIAIASGQRPDNEKKDWQPYRFAPGDILIKGLRKSSGGGYEEVLFGIETGGWYENDGKWFGSGDWKIEEGAPGSTFSLWDTGYTKSVTRLTDQVAGSVWETTLADWATGKPATTTPTQLVGGTEKDELADYAYNFAKGLGEHAFIELSVDVVLFNCDKLTYVRWAPSCGNDELYLSVCLDSTPPIPEPGSLVVWALLATSCGGYGWWRWSRRRQQGAK